MNKYITIDSGAFLERFPGNNGFAFTNLLLPPLDNSGYDLELAVMDMEIVGIQSPIFLTFDVECDLVEPYQCGDGMTQNIFTFLARRKHTQPSKLTYDIYQAGHYTYYP